jgi:hypothetical protein
MSSARPPVFPTGSGALAACLAALALGACGGSSSASHPASSTSEPPAHTTSSDTVAQVGQLAIDRQMLSHWMEIKLEEDYESTFRRHAPQGLVSEPPNYPACSAALRRLAPLRGTEKRKPPASAARLGNACQQLYRAIKTQALTYLVASDWLINFDSTHGVQVSDKETAQTLRRIGTEQHSRPGQSAESRRQAFGKAVYLAKIDLLGKKLAQRIQSEGGPHGKLAQEASTSADTAICPPEYVVTHCKQLKAPAVAGPSPSVVLRTIAG